MPYRPTASALCRLSLAASAVFFVSPLLAQTPAPPPAVDVTCKPVAQRVDDGANGCWILSDQSTGPLTQAQAFWHLETFPTLQAANAAKGSGGTVLTSLGQVWLFTIAEAGWQPPAGGRHVATIGPLPLATSSRYAAQYMEATFAPGMRSTIHGHPGTEAFYTTTGEVCLETPAGISFGRAGEAPVIIAEGIPMQLTATGTAIRRSVVLILHDATQPAAHPVHDWTPKGLCAK